MEWDDLPSLCYSRTAESVRRKSDGRPSRSKVVRL
jgi:hypothetical protein